MDDLLFQSAIAYQTLLPYQYSFLIGRKGTTKLIHLSFPEDRYHHLAGFQYISFSELRNKKTALKVILSKERTQEDFKKAGFTKTYRWQGICNLKQIIENNRFIFYYRNEEDPYSMIDADYFIKNDNWYLFMKDNQAVSLFGIGRHDYCICSTRYVTLKIWREDKQNSEKQLIYQSPSYIEKKK